ncbi:MAG TPA: bifunctional UDP-N-acetylglucosamine diphosphorylase/glucosamine-1-phosphate N-acetyltransferase GlmU, partial [Thermoanaerobaculia bacterium]|nr:bifunctional UDP-N-acetylglucosamine diphosphorylase/glucosamine-1-phosphate N-acetyltransferase GlmU [Thermoanaerobaculia bacterium]
MPAERKAERSPARAAVRRRVAVVLAAGQGKRMRSSRPKVLHPVAGRPALAWVIDAARAAGCDEVVVVVGHGAPEVEAAFAGAGVRFALQPERRGTGDAHARAAAAVPGEATLVVLMGDAPLVTAATVEALAAAAESGWGALAYAELPDPGDLGRVVLGADGGFQRIVEARDATPEERRVPYANAGFYAFPAPAVFDYLARLSPDNAQGELYLTDVPRLAAADGHPIAAVPLPAVAESWGINSRQDLARVHGALLSRHLDALMSAGVTVLDPARTVVEPGVTVGAETVLHPGVTLLGATAVGAGCELHAGAWLRDAALGDGVVVEPYTVIDGARVGDGAKVGPFARLRSGTALAESVRVGNFVEIKGSTLGAGAKAGHLAYLGDAEVGEEANVAAGNITANYDGFTKSRTKIGKRAK